MSVTFQKLAARIQAEIENDPKVGTYTQTQLMYIMNRVFHHIGDALASGEDVYLEGFGRFYPDCRPPRKVKSGLTDKEHTTKYRVFVRFNAFKQLNNQVRALLIRLGVSVPPEGEQDASPSEEPREE